MPSAQAAETQESSRVSWVSVPLAQQVAAAVAGGADGEHVAADQRGHRRGAHAGVVLAVVGGLEDPLVGQLDGGLQAVAVEGEVGLQPVGPGDLLLLVASSG